MPSSADNPSETPDVVSGEVDRGRVVYDPLLELMAKFEGARTIVSDEDAFSSLSIEEALIKHIVDGIKKGLEGRLYTAMEGRDPISIINDVLLEGMRRVGELFGAGKMQLPFVLGSAEVMKTAVAILEPHMPKSEGDNSRGSIVLATVAGDVHDIGKNLVDIILSNNGYRVVNIGIKQPIGAILEAVEKHKCDAIGMSGLLVKSTMIMKENLLEMNRRGLANIPVLLGGAALTRAYVEEDLADIYEGRVFYAKDAFDGLHIMERLGDPLPATSDTDDPDLAAYQEERAAARVTSHRVDELDEAMFVFTGERSATGTVEPPEAPFYGARRRDRFSIKEIGSYVNPVALFRGQWQFKRAEGMTNPQFTDWLEAEARPIFNRLLSELEHILQPKVTWGYFPCRSEGNTLYILDESGDVKEEYVFPRQRDGKRLCLADYFRQDKTDVVGFSAVTMGDAISEYERDLFAKDAYQEYLYVHGMGVEMAEALAEFWHREMRREMNLPDEPESKKELFGAKYHGARYSFGYPACPRLEDQTKLFGLLEPERVGIRLTEEFMLEPEQSTTAVIVHHPEARYFNVK